MDWLAEISVGEASAPTQAIIVRLIAAAVLGGAIGFEREIRDRAAGLRTHMLVALAAALFTTVSLEIFYALRPLSTTGVVDPIRAVEAVTAGVAFLGAGAIIQRNRAVKGLTTGAGMWMAGAIGVACATGHLLLAAVAAVLAILILWALWVVEHRTTKLPRKRPGDEG